MIELRLFDPSINDMKDVVAKYKADPSTSKIIMVSNYSLAEQVHADFGVETHSVTSPEVAGGYEVAYVYSILNGYRIGALVRSGQRNKKTIIYVYYLDPLLDKLAIEGLCNTEHEIKFYIYDMDFDDLNFVCSDHRILNTIQTIREIRKLKGLQ